LSGERVVEHAFVELLCARLDAGVHHKQHLHQLSAQVGVPDVVRAAQHHDDQVKDSVRAGVVQHRRHESEMYNQSFKAILYKRIDLMVQHPRRSIILSSTVHTSSLMKVRPNWLRIEEVIALTTLTNQMPAYLINMRGNCWLSNLIETMSQQGHM
jgi:hypothetical protein